MNGGTMTRDKPAPRVTTNSKDDKKPDTRILDALQGLPGKMEPGGAWR